MMTYAIVTIVAIIILLPLILGLWYLKTSVFHKPLGKDEWAFLSQVTEKMHPGIKQWVEQKRADGTFKGIFIISEQRLRIHAYYAECPDATATVILTHGYSSCAMQMMPYAKMWLEKFHCNVIVHDLPNHGQSEGKCTSMGYVEQKILAQWIETARQMFPKTKIYLHGISMGGATTLLVAGNSDYQQHIAGAISDSAYHSVWEVFGWELHKRHVPHFPFLYVASFLNKLVLGWSYKQVSPLKAISKSTMPVLIVHGDIDNRVRVCNAQWLFDAKTQGRKQLWITKGAEHVQSYSVYPDEYAKQIESFFNLPAK